MKKALLPLALLPLVLGACAPVQQALGLSYNVTVLNTGCHFGTTVFIDGQNVGTIPANGVRSFTVSRGAHSFNVDNDLQGDQTINVLSNMDWRGGRCL